MRCPTLAELPPPPPDKKGWPWTSDGSASARATPVGETLPRISIVTPSYNQGDFLEETIRSVLLQDYPDLEYIIIDGGSRDKSIDIITKYEKWLSYWCSAPDGGQVAALNLGFQMSTGAWLGYLNSDDTYRAGALFSVGSSSAPAWLVGACSQTDSEGIELRRYPAIAPGKRDDWLKLWVVGLTPQVAQPAVFWRRAALKELGSFSTSLLYTFDHEFFLRLTERYGPPLRVDRVLANYRLHPNSLTSTRHRWFRKERIIYARRFVRSYYPPRRISDFLRSEWALTQIAAEEVVELTQSHQSAWSLLFAALGRPPLLINRFYISFCAVTILGKFLPNR